MKTIVNRTVCFKSACMAAIMMSLTSTSAFASDLRENLSVTDDMVKLADLFTDTGKHGEEIVLEAPAPGKSIQISSFELTRFAKKYALDWQAPEFLKRVRLSREGSPVKPTDLQQLLQEHLYQSGINDNIAIRIFGYRKGVYLPLDASLYDIEVTDLDISDRQDRFSAVLKMPLGNNATKDLRITGSIDQVEAVPVLNRSIKPGDIITESDIRWDTIAIRRINNRTIQNANDLIGHTVKRPLRSGKILMTSDIITPVAIDKGEQLVLIFKVGAMQLTAGAQALERGGIGETISVMNLKSRQTIEAQITAPGIASVTNNNILKLASR